MFKPQTSCRFLQEDGRCTCKTDKRGHMLECSGACSLSQTEAQYQASLHKAWERFVKLPQAKQTEYMRMYYGGKTPWGARRYTYGD